MKRRKEEFLCLVEFVLTTGEHVVGATVATAYVTAKDTNFDKWKKKVLSRRKKIYIVQSYPDFPEEGIKTREIVTSTIVDIYIKPQFWLTRII